jgi:hypothetical protein
VVANPGTWVPRPQGYRFTWLRDGKVIQISTRPAYRVTKADLGHKLSVQVTVQALFYNAAVALSRPI